MKELRPKISIIGSGNVGVRYAYVLVIKGLARKIVMLDVNKKRLEGDVLDLSHGAPYVSPVEVVAGDYPDIKDSDIVVITAGKNITPGQTRLDVAKVNVGLYKTIIPEVVKYAPDAVILVVSNPVDVLSYAAYKISGKPKEKVIGSGTVLDSARLRFLLGNHCNIDSRNIHAYILGEHGDSEFPVWSKAMVGGISFNDYCRACKNYETCKSSFRLENIFKEVKDSAYRIISCKGETSYGIGLSLARITRAVLNNENSILPVSFLVEDFCGINDVYMSLPAIVNREGVREVINLDLNEKETELFKKSAQAIKKVISESGL
ncbi:MAG: L-lactate dehydrogenase [Endomicrobiales bacterium]|nr:L-lactate dehydrogenase [Endomicrobiales bacterium]